ncbi:hypothetical protein RvY_13151 [Ramazzottius varieornatus]|uniref:RING-type domain-containing protein n=1 Tax=Ramazzottius varieornatus TaxID=947166 RepID=A0A1D1VLX4_RAMVA|nr:hypothetical protein RvY_13151 [Ramazzottius varieornatus]
MDFTCPVAESLDICSVEDQPYGNGSLYSNSTWDHNATIGQYHREPTRSRLYYIFRKAAAARGFGSEYQSDLRRLIGERWSDWIWAIWSIAIPGTILLGLCAHCLQKKLFKRMRLPERQHTREKLWNYAFYKFIFIFGVVNVDSMEEMIIWVAWFVMLGYAHFFIVLSRDRCEYMTFSPSPCITERKRILALLASIIVLAVGILGLSASLFCGGFYHTGVFLAAEGALVLLPTVQIFLRYGYHQFRMQGRGAVKWENRTNLYQHISFGIDMGKLSVDLVHHLHMMWHVCNLSASSLVIVAQIRNLCAEIFRKFARHRSYIAIRRRLQLTFPSATAKEIDKQGDVCSICWDKMEQARKLRCTHVFHEACLLSWLEQDISCPVCRVNLSDSFDMKSARAAHNATNVGRFFVFQGSRINNWLPNVSVTVSHPLHDTFGDGGSVEIMAEQVLQVFPHVTYHAVIQDLLETGSAESTIENILNGTINLNRTAPPVIEPREPSHVQVPPTEPGTVPDTPEAWRALHVKRKEAMLAAARHKYIEKMAKERNAEETRRAQAVSLQPGLR